MELVGKVTGELVHKREIGGQGGGPFLVTMADLVEKAAEEGLLDGRLNQNGDSTSGKLPGAFRERSAG